jgi:hypothetical protein
VWNFDLQVYRGLHAPAMRQYFIQATATKAADRLDELVLVLDWDRV